MTTPGAANAFTASDVAAVSSLRWWVRVACRVPRVLALGLGLSCLVSTAAAPAAPLGEVLRAQMELVDALGGAAGSGPLALEQLYRDPAVPAAVRGRALLGLLAQKPRPLAAADRAQLLTALRDPAAEVRLAAARAVGQRGERPLERELLKLVAEDSDPRARVAGVVSLRRWTRQGHLYFLDRALSAPWPELQAEVLVNLTGISYREVPPELVQNVEVLAARSPSVAVRRQALSVLSAWGLLGWEELRSLIVDAATEENLRRHALELSDLMASAPGRDDLLLDLMRQGTGLRTAWAVFARLVKGPRAVANEVAEAVADYLTQAGEANSATQAMADHLAARGYRVRYRSGGWQISRP